jgi:hypothetical protein
VGAGYKFYYAQDAAVSHLTPRDWRELIQKPRKPSREAFEAAIEKPNGRLW